MPHRQLCSMAFDVQHYICSYRLFGIWGSRYIGGGSILSAGASLLVAPYLLDLGIQKCLAVRTGGDFLTSLTRIAKMKQKPHKSEQRK